ncbi:MAG: outer membrane lipid asymmetry maintenance protein MlaD [Alphaproteobacteria bacterium]|nr:outer membrane lipid asymmetry maintenance protein MlaD [Alphaproteobacteria bacterium]
MNKNSNYFEVIVGTFVLLCTAFFFFNSFRSAKVSSSTGYFLIAKFDNADGLNAGSDVKISGVKIGTVEEQILDLKTFRAALRLNINKSVELPSDSSAKIVSEGLLGSKYLAITPGGDDENLKNGDEIQFTQSSVNFEELLGKFIFSDKDKNNENK